MKKVFASNINGKVKNYKLSYKNAMLPIYEAITNSIFAIEQKRKDDPSFIGKIEVEFIRTGLCKEEMVVRDVLIKDNGVGFNEENMSSFMTSDSRFKEEFGGKGNGRFSWLKEFYSAEITSVFYDGVYNKRSFVFTMNNDEVDDTLSETNETDTGSIVYLKDLNEKYERYIPKETNSIVEGLIEHLIVYLLSDECPSIKIKDYDKTYSVNDTFKEMFENEKTMTTFNVGNYSFELTSLKIKREGFGHNYLYFCANNRLVKTKDVNEYIVNLDNRIFEKEHYWYLGVLTSAYLDSRVDYDRQSFSIEEDDDSYENEPSINKITREAVSKVKDYLGDYLNKTNEEKVERINKYVQSTAPEYRYLMQYKGNAIAKIKPGVTDDELDDSLNKIKRDFERETRKESEKLLENSDDAIATPSEYEQQFAEVVRKITDMNKSKLADYIVKRKAILDLFEKGLRITNNGKYHLEKELHNLIFHVKETSDSLDYESHNLWIIDEKMAYSSYVASDIPFNNDTKEDRTDILVCDSPVAVGNGENGFYNTISIFELKRPQRNDYSKIDNPIEQMIGYVKKIKTNKMKDRYGRPIRVNDSTQFFLYAICDLTDHLLEILNDNGHYTILDDNSGAFTYNENYHAYIEVISYDKLIGDSKLRNKVFFKKLGIEQ